MVDIGLMTGMATSASGSKTEILTMSNPFPLFHRKRNVTAGRGFFFERRWDVQQGDGFRKGSTHPTGWIIRLRG
jgi:hypothetical protein